jgi:hypothetical protein
MAKSKPIPVLLAVALLVLAVAAANVLVVKIQTTGLRKNPRFFDPIVLALKAGDQLEKIGEAGGWMQVRTASGVAGWVHGSAVETPKVQLTAQPGAMKTQASANEIALAGKGFNKQVEDSYRARHGDLNFAWVDRMLEIRVGLPQVEDFLKMGRLGEYRGVR